MTSGTDDLIHTTGASPSSLSLGHLLFTKFMDTHQYRHMVRRRCATQTPLDELMPTGEGWHIEWEHHDYDQDHSRLYRSSRGAGAVLAAWSASSCSLELLAAASSLEDAERLAQTALARAVPLPERPEAVRVTFWANTVNGPRARVREVDVSSWGDLTGNYSTVTRQKIDECMNLKPQLGGGQLLLWHGDPGTGKTHAIRALANEWRPWCNVHYVVDPDAFFGEADYMLTVILEAQDQAPRQETPAPALNTPNGVQLDSPDSPDPAAGGRWQLLVVEDADEFLRQDAKDRAGQALSRLLNLCDGLIGQGLRTLVLLTTNAPLLSLHPAVARPGRCLANVEFTSLDSESALRWLAKATEDGSAYPPHNGTLTLAELYDLVRDRGQIGPHPRNGPTGVYV